MSEKRSYKHQAETNRKPSSPQSVPRRSKAKHARRLDTLKHEAPQLSHKPKAPNDRERIMEQKHGVSKKMGGSYLTPQDEMEFICQLDKAIERSIEEPPSTLSYMRGIVVPAKAPKWTTHDAPQRPEAQSLLSITPILGRWP